MFPTEAIIFIVLWTISFISLLGICFDISIMKRKENLEKKVKWGVFFFPILLYFSMIFFYISINPPVRTKWQVVGISLSLEGLATVMWFIIILFFFLREKKRS